MRSTGGICIVVLLCAMAARASVYWGGSYDGYDGNADAGRIGYPQVNNADGATNVTSDSAWLNGTLTATGSAVNIVTMYWGGTDAGTNTAGWHTNRSFGVRAEGTRLTTNVTVSPHTRYYYRFYATNAAGEDGWASASATFLTPGAPVVTTGVGAAPVSYATAALNGEFVEGISAAIAVFWGTDTNTWAHTNSLGTRAEGAFAVTITGLAQGAPYYYRCRAVNGYGTGWSDVVAFTTRVFSAACFRGAWYDGYADWSDAVEWRKQRGTLMVVR